MHRVHRALAVCLLAAAAAPLVAPSVHAQTPFVAAQPYYLGPGSTSGVGVDASFQNFLIDSDGDGQIEPGEASHPVPLAFTNTVANSQYRLSPSRKHLVLFGSALNGPCTGQRSYYVYRIPPTSGDPLEIAGPPICVDTSEAFVGFHDPGPGGSNDLFFVVETSDPALEQEVWFKRLADGTTSAGSFPLDRSVGEVTFAPNGIAAFVQYDVDGTDNLDSYQMFELCSEDVGSFVGPSSGSVVDVTGGGVATAALVNATDAIVTRASDQAQIATYTLDDCSGPAPATGACCLEDGTCSPGMTEAGCLDANGTWQGAGTDCVGVDCPEPPAVEWALGASGPSTAVAPGSITYTIDYANTGDLDAGGATLTANVPSNATFASATAGGTFDAFTQRVTWNLGTVAAGGSGQVSFTVDVDCGVETVLFSQYFVQSTAPTTLTFGANSTSTAVSSGGGGGLDVFVSSAPDSNRPPRDGDTVTHTITMVETDGVARPGARLNFGVGVVWTYDATLDAAGGTVTPSTFWFQWMGDIAPNDTTRVVFRTRVPDCRQSFQTEDALNNGSPITVLGGCGPPIGQASPDTVALAPVPVRATYEIAGTGPVVAAPIGGDTALARRGGSIEFAARAENVSAASQDSVVLRFQVPSGLMASNDPPWIGTPPVGATWDAATATASWTGPLASGASVALRVGMDVPSDAPCRTALNAEVGYGNCSDSGRDGLWLLPVDEPYQQPHVISMTPFNGLWSYRPGVDTEQREYLCVLPEIQTGLAAGTDGDIWVAGTPTFRFDPGSLDLEFVDGGILADSLGMFTAEDVTVDPNSGVVYFSGFRAEPGPVRYPRIGSYDPATGGTAILLDETEPRTHFEVRGMDVLPDGRLVAITAAGLLVIDPVAPSTPTIWTDPSWNSGVGPLAVAARDDGLVYVGEITPAATDPKAIRVFDPDAGQVTPYVADLTDAFPLGVVIFDFDVDANGRSWAATGSPVLIEGDPNAGVLDLANGSLASDQALIWLPGSTATAVDDDTIPGVARPQTFALRTPTPNPFNPRTTIAFELPRTAQVSIDLYDARGRLVRTLVDGERAAGDHRVIWDGTDDQGHGVSSGVYYVRMLGGGKRFVQKAVLLR